MSALVPVPPITEPHYFASPQGYVFEVVYSPTDGAPGRNWGTNLNAGALEVEIAERASALDQAITFAQVQWPERGGFIAIDHKGHRA